MKNILMIYPEFPTTYWSLKHALAFINKKAAIPPLGLLTVAALLPDDYSVSLVDMNVEKLRVEQIERADLVFISAMIVQKESFEQVVALCNSRGVPVVAGGPYPTSSHSAISGVDHFVLDEAEVTLPDFIRHYKEGTPGRIYTSACKPDITLTPAPRFDLIDFRNYNNIALQNSRGCPFNCEFCDIIELFGRIPRYKETAQFVNEMELVYRQGFRGSLFIVDDNFIGNKIRVKELLNAIIIWQERHGRPFTFFTEASINLADDDELLDLMARAGFDMVFIGIETPETSTLEACDKKQNTRADMFDSIKKIQNAGIEVTGGFIVGFDQDTADIFERQIEFIQTAGIPIAMVGILDALPRTRLYRRLKDEGRLKAGTVSKGNNTHNLEVNFVPAMPEKDLLEGYKKIISEIYSPKKYFERCFTCITRLPVKNINRKSTVTLAEIRAFLRSLVRQTFSNYSGHYLNFLWKTLKERPEYFPLAVAFAIKGHHFFTITENILKADELAMQLARATKMAQYGMGLIARSGARLTPEVAALKKQICSFMKKIRRTYSRVGRDVQYYLREQFEDCEDFFNSFLQQTACCN
ncbi:MAG TPA: B12-binding domain-containing radical SAM protein [Spirochaetota bacterium]|nr:B12-binding domain-containing radical SAM protein [Spirochaetota bacterium]